jgi:hypothetical protein
MRQSLLGSEQPSCYIHSGRIAVGTLPLRTPGRPPQPTPPTLLAAHFWSSPAITNAAVAALAGKCGKCARLICVECNNQKRPDFTNTSGVYCNECSRKYDERQRLVSTLFASWPPVLFVQSHLHLVKSLVSMFDTPISVFTGLEDRPFHLRHRRHRFRRVLRDWRWQMRGAATVLVLRDSR